VCPTLGCGYHYPLPGKTRESPRHWALRRRARIRECRQELREAMFTSWSEQSRSFLVPFFSFALVSYVLSLGQWINLRPLDAALLVGFLGACTLRVYLGMLRQRERETEDVQRRIQRRHKRWLAAIESASNLELGESSSPAMSSSASSLGGTPPSQLMPSTLQPLPSSAWYPQSPPSEWGHEPPLPGALF